MNNHEIQIETLFEYFIVMLSRHIDEKEQDNLISLAKYLTNYIN